MVSFICTQIQIAWKYCVRIIVGTTQGLVIAKLYTIAYIYTYIYIYIWVLDIKIKIFLRILQSGVDKNTCAKPLCTKLSMSRKIIFIQQKSWKLIVTCCCKFFIFLELFQRVPLKYVSSKPRYKRYFAFVCFRYLFWYRLQR